ncbi:methyltransferase [Streptomyces netropsis]
MIVEPVLPTVVSAGTTEMPYLSDLNMLVNVGGRERTADDFTVLCTEAGFKLGAISPLPQPNVFHVIEATPA